MGEARRKFDKDFREGAVRLVRETGKPIAQVARDLGINSGTLGNWVDADRRHRGEGDGALSEDERAELARLRNQRDAVPGRLGDYQGGAEIPRVEVVPSRGQGLPRQAVVDGGGHERARTRACSSPRACSLPQPRHAAG
jgi:transposase